MREKHSEEYGEKKKKKGSGCLIAFLIPLAFIFLICILPSSDDTTGSANPTISVPKPSTTHTESTTSSTTKAQAQSQDQEPVGGFFDGLKKGYEYGKSAEKVSRNAYDHIQDGTTYEEVVEIFGCDGMLMQTLDLNGAQTKYYQWVGEGKNALIQITFMDNEVIYKTAYNLNGT